MITTFSVILLLLVILGFIYVPLKSNIDAYLKRPSYSEEQLRDMMRKRELAIIREKQNDQDRIENGVHVQTGLIYDENLKYIQRHCISCHSPKLISQNRSTRSGWKQMIVWMQETQGLHDFPEDEKFVLDYLSKHYGPQKIGRRANLDIESIEWYVLNLEE